MTKDILTRGNDVFEELQDIVQKELVNTRNSLNVDILQQLDGQISKLKEVFYVKRMALYLTYTMEKGIVEVLKKFCFILKYGGFEQRAVNRGLLRYLNFLIFLVSYANLVEDIYSVESNLYLHRNFDWDSFYYFTVPSLDDNIEILRGIAVKLGEELLIMPLHSHSRFKVYANYHRIIEVEFKSDGSIGYSGCGYYLQLTLLARKYDDKVSDLIYAFGAITTGFESLANVHVGIESIEIGSLDISSRITMDDLVAKGEVKELLLQTKEALIAHFLKKPIREVSKAQAEIDKLLIETKIQQKQLDALPSSEAAEALMALEIEKIKLLNEQLKIQNEKDKLDYIKTLAKLVKNGILRPDYLELTINGLMYININKEENQDDVDLDEILE
ncbi:MAG: hypothetical protein JST32_10245 [Bacteroidetes bacterium]|nr:hypothetical protein [Bacteroidota bacterium]